MANVRLVELNPSSRPWALVGTLVVFAGLSKQLLDNIPMFCFIDRELLPPIRIAVEGPDGRSYSLLAVGVREPTAEPHILWT